MVPALTRTRLGCITLICMPVLFSCTDTEYNHVCVCCERTYQDINSALTCLEENPYVKSTADPRALLIVFSRAGFHIDQDSAWSVLQNEEIVQQVMREYLLVTLDASQLHSLKARSPGDLDHLDQIHEQDSIFFVITNTALIPFHHWARSEEHRLILDKLRVGLGP